MKRIILAVSAAAMLTFAVGAAIAADNDKADGSRQFWENKAGLSGQGG